MTQSTLHSFFSPRTTPARNPTTRNPSKKRRVSSNGDDPSLVPGLTVIQEFITPLQETRLLAFLDGQPWRTDLARRTMHFGGTYCLMPKANLPSEARIKYGRGEENLFRAQREQSPSAARGSSRAEREQSLSRAQREESLSSAASITYEQARIKHERSEKKLFVSRAQREESSPERSEQSFGGDTECSEKKARAQREESLSSGASITYEQSEKNLSRAERTSAAKRSSPVHSEKQARARAQREQSTSNARISSEHSEQSFESKARPEIITAPPIPPQFASLLELFSTKGIYPASHPPGYCIVNEYLSPHGISAHVENYTFGEPVCSLTLHDGDHLRFHELSAPNDGSVRSGKAARAQRTGRKVDVWLAPRSLAVMRGDARRVWQHEVVRGKRGRVASRPGEEWRRTSLTFRVDR